MFALYPAHRTYTQWSVGPGLTQASAGTLTMVFSDSPAQAALITAMPRYPELMASGQSFRRGGHTLTGIFDLNGIPVFGKYVDFRKKNLWSRLRYNFMPSRGLWSAFIADYLAAHQIPTPKVLGAGEVRQNGLIAESYIFTEVLHVEDILRFLIRNKTDPQAIENITRQMMQRLRRFHDLGITHGDLKLDNFYLTQGEIGAWDLDSTLYWPHGVPFLSRWRNMGHLIANLVFEIQKWTPYPLASVEDFTRFCCEAYGVRNNGFIRYFVRRFLKKIR